MFLRELLKVIQVDAILTANYVYAWQQELAVICDEMNIPVVILFKEGISPLYSGIDNRQNAYDLLVKYYTNNRFLGSKLLVYNENIRDAFIRANIEGLNKNAVETVGIPRFDRYFRLKKNGKDIVFFSFSIEDKARHLGLDKEVLCDYLEKQEKFHIEVMKYAKSYPDKNVIIKTKSNTKYLNYTKKIAIENGCSKLNNLVITNKGNVYDYIKNSYAVIGYNSTVLLEALAAGRLIINPDFREGIVCDFFEEYPNLANYAKNMEDIHNVISSIVVDTVNNDDLKSLLYDRIYVPDGQACLRTEICIKNSIMYSKQ